MYKMLWKRALVCAMAIGLTVPDVPMSGSFSQVANAAAAEPLQRGGEGNRNRGEGNRGGGKGGPQKSGVQQGGGRPQGGRSQGGGAGQIRGGGAPGGSPRSAPGQQRASGLQGNVRAPRSGVSSQTPNRGTIHVPPSGVTRRSRETATQRPSTIRTPSPTRPRTRSGGGLNGVADRPSVRGPVRNTAGNIRRDNPVRGAADLRRDIDRSVRNNNIDQRTPGTRNFDRSGRDNPLRSVTGNLRGDRPGNRNDRTTRNDVNNNNINNNSIRLNNNTRNFNNSNRTNRRFDGNVLSLNNRQFNLGSNNYRPSHYRHDRHHGYWNGNGNGYGYSPYNGGFGGRSGLNWGIGLGSGYGYGNYGTGNYGYGRGRNAYRPFGWGLGGWGLGSLLYNSGYLRYSNPYYVSGGTTVYNYAQPIPVYYTTSAESTTIQTVTTDVDSADEILNDAIAEFQQSNYEAALDITNKGISTYPDDAVLHEFRALVLFALKDYQQSAATIHSVLAVGPGWDWTTLASMYSNVAVYTDQLRDLEAFTRSNPLDPGSRLLLGYHYMTCGHTEAAATQFQQVVGLKPEDRVASDLHRMLSPPAEESPSDQSRPPHPTEPQTDNSQAPKVDPSQLIGQWKATRDDGSSFNLALTSDAKFTWAFSAANQKAEEFSGTYTLEGNVIALEQGEGGALIAEVTPEADGRLQFRLLGAPQEDPGLTFSR